MELKIGNDWDSVLAEEKDKPYFAELEKFVEKEYAEYTVYPPRSLIFAALRYVPFEDVKVVIVGQDPYINEGQAHGLCFSVESGLYPPSLKNVFKEIHSELGCYIPSDNGNLTKWANQGVLLLNTILTVEKGKSLSHKDKGWEIFTHEILKKIAEKKTPVVFILWGNWAKNALNGINLKGHYVLTSTHPSPFSANYGFFGCGHFKKCNQILTSLNQKPIDWQIEEK